MPPRKSRNTRRRRPRARRMRLRRPVRGVNTRSQSGPLANVLNTKFAYETGWQTSSASLVPITFRLNSLYAPEYTYAGHQPRGFDEMQALYKFYRVLGVKFVITGYNYASVPCYIGYNIDPIPTAPGDTNSYYEARRAVVRCVKPESTTIIKGYTSVAKALGVSPSKVRTDDQFAADVGSNPVQIPFIHVFAHAMNSTSSCVTNISLKMTFYCQLSVPQILNQS